MARSLEPSADVQAITLISGPDYTSVRPRRRPRPAVPLPTTTTTAPPATTTTTTEPRPNTTVYGGGRDPGVDPNNPDSFVAPAPPAGVSCG